MTHTRKDICFYVSYLCRFMRKFGAEQWNLAMRVMRYLAGTSDMQLVFDVSKYPQCVFGEGVEVQCWVDSSFADRVQDSRSSSGLLFQLNGCTIDAVCMLQKRPAQDTCEAEWYGVQALCKWIEWYRALLGELKIKYASPTVVRHDNQVVTSLIRDNERLGRTLHWRIAQHYPRYLYLCGVVDLDFWRSEEMAADMLSKALPFPALQRHRRVIQGMT